MAGNIYDKTVNWDRGEAPNRAQRPAWLMPLACGLLAVSLTAAMLGFAAGRFGHSSKERTAAKEVVAEEFVGASRVLLTDRLDGAAWLTYYRANSTMLGQPLWGESRYGANGDCVGFTNYIVCRSADPGQWGTDQEYMPQALGTEALPEGLTKQLGAPRADIVQRYADLLNARGQDWFYWLGRPISQPYCPPKGDECFQALERQLAHWPNRPDAKAQDVRLSPLGLRHPKP